jgi:hypothetical protein
MPKSKAMKAMKKQKSGKKKQKKQGKGNQSPLKSGSKGLINKIMAPPVTYAGEYNTGTYMRWGLVNGNPVAVFRIKIGTVTLNYYNDTGAYYNTSIVVAAGSLGGVHFPFAVHNLYTPAMLLQLNELFSKDRWSKLCYEFVPRATGGTGSGYALTWAFTDDPAYAPAHLWSTSATGIGSGYNPSESQIASMEGARQFPVWLPEACMDASKHLDKKWLFTSNPYIDDSGPLVVNATADLRQSCPGMLAISGSDNTFPSGGTTHAVISTTVGSLFYSGAIELQEFNPPILNDTPDLLHSCGQLTRKSWDYCPKCGEVSAKLGCGEMDKSERKRSVRKSSSTKS